MPAVLAPFFGFALGVLFAWLAPAHHGLESGAARPLPVVVSFAALLFVPATAFFLVIAPDWSVAYLVEGSAVPSAVSLVGVVLVGVLVVAGYLAARPAVRRRAFQKALFIGGLPAATGVALLLILWPRLAVEGSYRRFHGDFGVEDVAGGPLGFCILWVDTLLVLGLWMCVRALSERSRGPGRRLGPTRISAQKMPAKHPLAPRGD